MIIFFVQKKRIAGIVTLLMTVVLLLVSTMMIFFAAQNNRIQTRLAYNATTANQAFLAAEAGIEYGIAYFLHHSSEILTNPVSGFIQHTIAAVTQSDQSSYTVTYANSIANNYRLLTISAVGRSRDGSSTKTIRQQIQWESLGVNLTASALSNVTVVGGSTLTNTKTNINIRSGGTVVMNNGAQTFTSTGFSSTQGNYKADVQQNVAALQNITKGQFFNSLFHASEGAIKNAATMANNYFTSATNPAGSDYSQALKNKVGATIWIDQPSGTANIGQGVTIGSPTKPVVIIVNGDLHLANGVTVYGMIYVSGRQNGFTLAGGAQMYGGIASGTTMHISNAFRLNYDDFGGAPIGGYLMVSKIPGSWKDF